MELGAIRTQRATRLRSRGLDEDRNGSLYSRHLFPAAAFPVAANDNEGLNAQEFRAFPQVRSELHLTVASL
jgi:hypothetical protein